MSMGGRIRIGALFLLVLGLAGCGGGNGGAGESAQQPPADIAGRSIQVVTTTGMIADIARIVGGERARVRALMGPGVDPHLYKASEGDVRRLSEADLIFYNGLHLEAKMAEVLGRLSRQKRTVAVAEAVARERLLTPPEFEGSFDPHIWFDVTLWMEAVAAVRTALYELDPQHGTTYDQNARAYLSELGELHGYVTEQIAGIPHTQRVLITAHDAFNYFGRAYNIEVRGLQGISTNAEAGTADVQKLAEFITQRRVPAIFVESSVPPRAIQAVQAAVESRKFSVAIGGQLYSDALGSPDSEAGTYVGMVRHNTDTLVRALRSAGPKDE
jgi:manganese/zinc/iron transport system substrate-binding protein